MTSQQHDPISSPDGIAAADLMHTRGRNWFAALVRDYNAHKDACDAPDCHIKIHGEEVAVAHVAAELYNGTFACGHNTCIETSLQSICEALAYAAIRTAEGRSLNA